MRRTAIGGVLADFVHKSRDDIRSDTVDAVIVVTKLRRRTFALVLVIDNQTCIVANDVNLAKFYCRKTIGDYREAGDAERHCSQNIAIMQRHLQPFVEIFVMHVMDAIHRMHVGAGEPLHHIVEFRMDVVVIEFLANDRRSRWSDLLARNLVAAAIDGVEQRLGEVHASAEKLHLLSQPHCRNAARNAVIIAPIGTHEVVVFVLQ